MDQTTLKINWKYFELNENTSYQNLGEGAKALVRGKLVALIA